MVIFLVLFVDDETLLTVIVVKEIFFEEWLRDEFKKWSSHLLDNLSDCLICASEKFPVSSTGYEPMTSAEL